MARRTHSKPTQPETEPKEVINETDAPAITTVTAVVDATSASEPGVTELVATVKLPSGKLGVIVAEIATAAGAAINELVGATGWQPHTIRAAFSRLRRRGFPIVLSTDADGRKAYRLDVWEG